MQKQGEFWASVGELTSLGLTLGLCVLLPVFGGWWLGKRFGHEDVGLLLGLALGIAAGGVELSRTIQRLNQVSRERGASKGREDSDDGTDGEA
ncbi:hypothetical protein FJZ36_16575 [Candidatus Poribacteria bacterium]|nr:hypothetical protein [Candidatus Poribacteria bacterium]